MSFVSAIDAPQRVSEAIKNASRATGTDFAYLLETAARESSFKVDAQAKTSSATGLFQFVDNTWLQMVKEEGPSYGLGDYAAFILKGRGGRYYVSDPALKQEILDLRNDPEVAAVMAGAFTQQNAAHVGAKLGREPTGGELYIAHVLGAEGASRLIALANDRPDAPADGHFPRAAWANRAIFYADGEPRSVAEVYDILARKTRPSAGAVKEAVAAPSLPERKPTAATAAVGPLAPAKLSVPASEAGAGGIGTWTTLLHVNDEGAAGDPGRGAGPVEPRVSGFMERVPATGTSRPAAEAAAPVPTEPARPKGIKIPSAAFRFFSEEILSQVEMNGA